MILYTTVVTMKRLRNSPDGNPAWSLVTAEGMAYRTKPDTMMAFELTDALVGKYVALTLERGQITDVEVVP